MRRRFGLILSLTFVLAAAGPAAGGPERVAFPKDYAKNFTIYDKIDKTKKKKKEKVRFMYANPAALSVTSGPLPSGSIIIMEDHAIEVNADGTPKLASTGRLIPTPKVKNVFVMEKREGWGAAYPADERNGDWEYAWFQADGMPKPGKTMEKCFACHKAKASATDFVFTMKQIRAKAK
jgi:hypothetical protein